MNLIEKVAAVSQEFDKQLLSRSVEYWEKNAAHYQALVTTKYFIISEVITKHDASDDQ